MAKTLFEVRLNQRLAQAVDAIASENGICRAEVFRRGVGFDKLAKDTERQAGQLILRTQEGSERELVSL